MRLSEECLCCLNTWIIIFSSSSKLNTAFKDINWPIEIVILRTKFINWIIYGISYDWHSKITEDRNFLVAYCVKLNFVKSIFPSHGSPEEESSKMVIKWLINISIENKFEISNSGSFKSKKAIFLKMVSPCKISIIEMKKKLRKARSWDITLESTINKKQYIK